MSYYRHYARRFYVEATRNTDGTYTVRTAESAPFTMLASIFEWTYRKVS